MPKLNVDIVDLYGIQELPAAVGMDETWVMPVGPASGVLGYKQDVGTFAEIVAGVAGSAIVLPTRLYRPGVSMPAGSSLSVDKKQIIDPYLDGKVYDVNRRGVELMMKGIEWDNTVPGGGIELLQFGDTFTEPESGIGGDVIQISFQPQVSPILPAPNAIGRFISGITNVTSDMTITSGVYRNLFILNSATTTLTLTLPPVASYPLGIILPISSTMGLQRQSTIQCNGLENIYWNGTTYNKLFMGQNDTLILTPLTGHTTLPDGWYVSHFDTTYHQIGHVIPGYMPGANQIIAAGQILQRAAYPRTTDFVLRLNAAYPGTVMSAANWPSNKTFWGFGNGTTTIQVPDLGGYHPRYLDFSGLIDIDRANSGLNDKPGSSQASANKEHNHGVSADILENLILRKNGSTTGNLQIPAGADGYERIGAHFTQSTGNAIEARGINVGLPALIYI